MVRIVEHHDWVIFGIFGCIVALVLTFTYLNRESTLKEFFVQKKEDATNIFLIWMVISVVFCVQLTTLVSQYLPSVPELIDTLNVLGYTLNKFGYVFLVLGCFFLLRTVFTFFFYSSVNQMKNFNTLVFSVTRYYFVIGIVLMVFNFINYYILINKEFFLRFIFISLLSFFIFKQFFYLFNKNEVLPKQWYYKILYICTLQIAPLFAVWRLLFF